MSISKIRVFFNQFFNANIAHYYLFSALSYIIVTTLLGVLLSSMPVYGQQYLWKKRPNFPGGPINQASSFTIGKKGYVCCGNKGSANGYQTKDCWQYDTALKKWSPVTDFKGAARLGASSFGVGKKGFLGLGKTVRFGSGFKDFWEYDPISDKWTQMADFPGGKRFQASGFAINTKAYVGLGKIPWTNTWKKSFWRYNPSGNNWQKIAPYPGAGRSGAVSFTINGSAFVGLGSNGGSQFQDFYRYDTGTQSWAKVKSFPGTPRSNAIAFSADGKGFIGLGGTSNNTFKDLWQYNPIKDTWKQVATIPASGRENGFAFSVGRKAFIGTGNNSNGKLSDFRELKFVPPCVDTLWQEKFDAYNVGSYPQKWENLGNGDESKVISRESNSPPKSALIKGSKNCSEGSLWRKYDSAYQRYQFRLAYQFTGNESSGCQSQIGKIRLASKADSINNRIIRPLLRMDPTLNVLAMPGKVQLASFDSNEWVNLRIQYEINNQNVDLAFLVNDTLAHDTTLSKITGEKSLKYLGLTSGNAEVLYDDVLALGYEDIPNCRTNVQLNFQRDFCLNDSAFRLRQGLPNGGRYSGVGIVNDTLNPSKPNTGKYQATYIYKDSNGWVSTNTDSFRIQPFPKVNFQAMDTICGNKDSLLLAGGSPAGGIYKGDAVSGDSFLPPKAGSGQQKLYYQFTKTNGCSAVDSTTIQVVKPPSTTMDTFKNICVNAKPLQLSSGKPKGGQYLGEGVDEARFNPAMADTGQTAIKYLYTDNNQCRDTAVRQLTVLNKPSADLDTIPPLCENSGPVKLDVGRPKGGSYDGAGVQSDTLFLDKAGAGNRRLQYVKMNQKGCSDTAFQKFRIKGKPKATIPEFDDRCVDAKPLKIEGAKPEGGKLLSSKLINDTLYPSKVGPGEYKIRYVYNNEQGCYDTALSFIHVYNTPKVRLENIARDFCIDDDAVPLKGLPENGTYSGKGVRDSQFNPSFAGEGQHVIAYSYQDSNGCQASDSVKMTVTGKLEPIEAFDTTICQYDSIQLDAGSPDAEHAWINQGKNQQKLWSGDDKAYIVKVKNACYQQQDTFTIRKRFVCVRFWVPTAFTPNGDGKNENFKVKGSNIQEVDIRIYNRWGEKIYNEVGANPTWDGTINGKKAQAGVYHYKVIVTGPGPEYSKRGTVHLIR